MSKSPTDAEVEAALRFLTTFQSEEYANIVKAGNTLRAALAAKDAEIERLTVLLGQTMSVHPDPDALNESRRILAQAERNYQQVQLAAAENRGFRAAAEWVDEWKSDYLAVGSRTPSTTGSYAHGCDTGVRSLAYALRAEADRREGK